MKKIIVGVDGGGTKSRFAALDCETGVIAAVSESGSIHALSLGLDEAARQLGRGIAALGIERDGIAAVSIGDPSLDDGDPADGEPLRRAALEFCAPDGICVSKSDVFMALYGFSRGEPAALLVSGTGSMGVAFTEPYRLGGGGGLVTVGGWGYPTGDPGSGYSIAVAGIRAAADAFDGVGPRTALCGEALKFFGAETPHDLIGILNSPKAGRAFIASFAPRVEHCAANGDAVGAGILENAGETLAKYAISLLSRLGPDRRRLGFYGGILLRCRPVREKTEKLVRERFQDAVTEIPSVLPEVGAALFAADQLGIKTEPKC